MAREMRGAPSLARKINKIEPKVNLVIACEGKNTEPDYIGKCVDYYGAGFVSLKVIPDHGVPLTVVRAAIAEKERLRVEALKSRGSRPAFSVWALFDKDDFDVGPAFKLANENKIQLAFSNPCFELWPLLHLADYGAQDGRGDLQRRLRADMPGYDHEAGAYVNFDLIKDRFELAHERAERLIKAREDEVCELGCPSTTVGRLIKKIIQNGKVAFNR